MADQRGRSLKEAQLLTAELTQRAERAEKTVAERSRHIGGMQSLLDRHQRARADLSAIATELQSRLDAESAWQTYDRAELLQAEVDELRRQRDETLAEREQLSARILHLMMPIEYRPQLALGYDPAEDPLVRQKRVELTVLAQYWEWQDAHAKRRTGRPMNQTKTMDEQALEAAQCARWMLINDPPQRLRSEPCWVEFPWKLDEASETLAIQMSEEKILDRMMKMSVTAD